MWGKNLETPKKGDAIVPATAPPTPYRDVSSVLHLPARFGTNREFRLYMDESNVVVISNQADDALVEEVCALNESSLPNAHKVIFRHKNLLLFQMEVDPSDIHQECAEFMMKRFQTFSDSLERRTSISPLYTWRSAKRKLHYIPDVIFQKDWVVGKNHLVTALAEVCYGKPLDITHARLVEFADEYPTLRVAFIIRIGYPWQKYPPEHPKGGFFDITNGKMTIFRYDFPDFDRASSAISFGNNPITNADIESFVAITNIDANNITGYGIGDAPACNAPDMPLYQVLIDRDILFMDYTNAENEDDEEGDEGDEGNKQDDVLPVTMRDRLLEALGENVDELDFHIDLFDLKRAAIRRGIDTMNETIQQQTGIIRPRIT